MRHLPSSPELWLARQLCLNHEAWIVGSAALPDVDFDHVKDVDILVPWARWHRAAGLLLPLSPKPNSLGGWHVSVERSVGEPLLYDVWPGDLTFLAGQPRFRAAWCPEKGMRLLVDREA